MSISPFFKNELAKYDKLPVRLIAAGFKGNSVLGSQLIFTILSELGFVRPADALNKMNEVLIRFNSRFAGIRHFIGNVIIDSSAKFEQSVPEKFEESVPKKELYVIKPSHFIVRPDQYRESHGKVFKLYRGDSKVLPHIMTEEELNDETIDKDRIIDVPIQLKFMFESGDIVRALNDYCGIPYSNKDLLFSGDLTHLLKCASIRNKIPEVITVDFFNMNDTIYDKVSPMLEMVPRMTHLFIHFDISNSVS